MFRDEEEGPGGFRKIGFVGLVVGLLMLVSMVGTSRAEEGTVMATIIEQAKTWDYSLGSYIYLFGAKSHNYGFGINKEIGKHLGLPEGWLDMNFGYIKGFESLEKEYGYGGLSLNAGRGIAEGIEWVSSEFGAEIKMPDFLKESMLKVGFLGATKLERFFRDWDCGVRVNIIEYKFR